MIKSGVALGTVMAVGAYFSGAFDTGYSRVVQRPPAQVMAALEDLDITAQPGAPGTDPSRSGGVKPLFRLAKGPNAMTWYVMSGDQVATRMTATLEPLNGGAETRVTTSVERGDAPDDRVSPAFRSVGLTKALFSMAVEGELNQLTRPAITKTAEECQEIFARDMAGAGMRMDEASRNGSLTQAIGAGAMTTLKMHATQDHMRQAGCDVDGGSGGFKPVSNEMKPAMAADQPADWDRDDGVKFQPGKPMVDVKRR